MPPRRRLGRWAAHPSRKGDQNRANRKLFVSPNGRKSVSGEISANGWRRIWKA